MLLLLNCLLMLCADDATVAEAAAAAPHDAKHL